MGGVNYEFEDIKKENGGIFRLSLIDVECQTGAVVSQNIIYGNVGNTAYFRPALLVSA